MILKIKNSFGKYHPVFSKNPFRTPCIQSFLYLIFLKHYFQAAIKACASLNENLRETKEQLGKLRSIFFTPVQC